MKYIIIFLLFLNYSYSQNVEVRDTQNIILKAIDGIEVKESAILIFRNEKLPDKSVWRVIHKVFILKNGNYIEIRPTCIKYVMR